MAILWKFVLLILEATSFIYAAQIHASKQTAFDEIAYPVVHSHGPEKKMRENVHDVSVLFDISSTDETFQSVRNMLTARGIGVLDKRSTFSIYDTAHNQEAEAIVNSLSSAPSFNDFIERARIIRAYTNPGVYNYALRSAVLVHAQHDEDYSRLEMPEIFNVAARSFFTDEAVFEAVQRSRGEPVSVDRREGKRPETAQQSARYFTDDIGLNAFHHSILLKTMRHADIAEFKTSRYNAEMFAAGMHRVMPLQLSSQFAISEEGYDSHLSSYTGEKRFAARPANSFWQDDVRDLLDVSSHSELRSIHANLLQAIRDGYFTDPEGNKVAMTNENLAYTTRGLYVDRRSCINAKLYGQRSFGILAHRLMSIVADPDGRLNQEPGVIGTLETSLRDPLTWQLHETLNDFTRRYQLTLPSYSQQELAAPVTVESINVQMDNQVAEENVLETFMEQQTVDIGMDPSIASQVGEDAGPVEVQIERLNHQPFHYDISINNNNPLQDFTATVRIFIAPRHDETGERLKSLNKQKHLMIEMDKFVVKLTPGKNAIRRSSELSSFMHPVLLTPDQQLRYKTESPNRQMHCGWPLNLLVPRGTSSGMDFDLFVMVTDWNKDRSDDFEDDAVVDFDRGVALCGVEGSRANPDGRPFRFPFDRKFDEKSLSKLSAGYDNMIQTKITIRHMSDQIILPWALK